MSNIPYEHMDENPLPSSDVGDFNGNPRRVNPGLVPQQFRPAVSKLIVRNDGNFIDFCVRCNKMVIIVQQNIIVKLSFLSAL